MTNLEQMYDKMVSSMGIANLNIPLTAVKFYRGNDTIPDEVVAHQASGLTLTSCQATKQAGLGDAVCLTIDNIGCVAAAISFGLVDPDQETALQGSRVYTDIMKAQADKTRQFKAPSPADFTQGRVYACKDAALPEYALFGPDDSGRYKDVATAKKAVADMMAVKPADTKAVFFFSKEFADCEIIPDVIVLSVRPVELTRIIQAYQFNTGQRVCANMGGLRAVNSDLIVRPYLTKSINISPYCLGARLIAQYEANRLGAGLPFADFEKVVSGMHDSETGFPFHLYPGAEEH